MTPAGEAQFRQTATHSQVLRSSSSKAVCHLSGASVCKDTVGKLDRIQRCQRKLENAVIMGSLSRLSIEQGATDWMAIMVRARERLPPDPVPQGDAGDERHRFSGTG